MNLAPVSNEWVLQPRVSHDPAIRLFCFPHAGGGASLYNSWTDELPARIEVCPVQLPGRENLRHRPPYAQLRPLIDELLNVLQEYLNLPFAFYGHSMGALVSFELTRQMRQRRLPQPYHLFVSSFCAPQLTQRTNHLHELPDAEFLLRVQELQGIPDALLEDAELIELFSPLLRADFAVCENYEYYDAEPLECGISSFGGTDDKRVSAEELGAWRVQTRSSFKMRLFPGNHFFLNSSKQLLLRVIRQELRTVLRSIPPAR